MLAVIPTSAGTSIEKEACTVGQFLPAMSCSKDPESAACCGGMHVAFDAQCACKALPGIVISHGGSTLGLLDSFIRCGFSEGVDANGDPIPPIDYVTQRLGCIDRKEWCNDKLHNLDVRLTESDKGFVQIHDAAKGWVYASADEQNALATASSVCNALGYAGALAGSANEGVHASKRFNCAHELAHISECAVEDVALQQGALYARCDRQGKFGPRSELCQRVGQGGYSYNNLACWPSVQTGVVVPLHTRKPGASHTLCGTAGINESRVQWYDGFQDDFFAYSASRRADGRLVKADVFKGELFGTDLLSPSELEVRGRTDILVAWRSTVVDMQGKFQRLFGADHSSDWRRRS
ncbi:hypothetical protein KFE25_012511 [Diacronema lutheri]|uniref:SRCR domain-containing protein n=1 Tax=Diacronema lutheri TaxID=2081491 RepID=A0A8J5XIL0_DIALT|nr:hypothetical protein KFE25_012511 [Diacronema lutheri]